MRQKLKIFSFLPTIFMLCIIFSFSGQQGDASSELSRGITYKIVKLEEKIMQEKFDNDMLEQKIEELHFYVRKIGHVTEFFLLALSMFIPCFVYRVEGRKFVCIPLIFSIFFAGLDEFHQLFVSGRDGALRDVFIDSIGIVFAVLFMQIGRKMFFVLREKWINSIRGKDS